MSTNGYLTASELSSIGSGLFLRNDAAAAWLDVMHHAATDYHQNIQSSAIASAYRPWAMQLDMRKNPAKYGINPNLRGLPGLPSRHGLGVARDVPFGAPNDWMIEYAAPFGWARPAATMALGDKNHWEFTPGTATAGSGGTPIAVEEDDMFADTDRTRLNAVYAAMFGPANLPAPQMTWAKPFGEAPGSAFYGLLDISINSQALIAGLGSALTALATAQGLDAAAITKAAHDGAASVVPAPIDTAALATAIAASLNTSNGGGSVDVAAIAQAVDAALADNFAAIPTHFTITGEAK